jgi:hypothetical protein
VNGALYGPTSGGGLYTSACHGDYSGCGTIFKITMSGMEKLRYTFQGVPDGADPYATLIAVNNVLYGTTEVGAHPTKAPSSRLSHESSRAGRRP